MFARTTDGGLTWEAPRAIVQTASQSYIQFSQVLVLPNGKLVDIFEFYKQQPNKPITFTNLQVMRSTDHGQTWSAPTNAVTMMPLYLPSGQTSVTSTLETGQFVYDVTNPSFAVDNKSGNLYAVWEDGRFSNFPEQRYRLLNVCRWRFDLVSAYPCEPDTGQHSRGEPAGFLPFYCRDD